MKFKTVVFADKNAFNDREDKSVNGVSPDFAAIHPDYEAQRRVPCMESLLFFLLGLIIGIPVTLW